MKTKQEAYEEIAREYSSRVTSIDKNGFDIAWDVRQPEVDQLKRSRDYCRGFCEWLSKQLQEKDELIKEAKVLGEAFNNIGSTVHIRRKLNEWLEKTKNIGEKE
jgi:hypothetical protein